MAPPSPHTAATAAPPARYFCPITTEIMADPVMDRHGHNFERAAILDWLARTPECPMSRCPLCPDDLFPNLALKEDIELWLADHPEGADGAPPLPLPVEPPAPAKAPAPQTDTVPGSPVSVPRVPHASAVAVDPLADPSPRAEPPQPPQRAEEGEGEREAAPWLRLNIPQEEYDMLVGLFYSFCTRAGILTRIEAQRLLRFMNYHEAVGSLAALDSTVTLEQFVTFAAGHRPEPADYGLSVREYHDIVHRFRELDVAHRGAVDRTALRTLCAALNVEDQSLGFPEAPTALFTCHDFLLRLRDARGPASPTDAARTAAIRGRAPSTPFIPTAHSNRPRPLERQPPDTARTAKSPSPRPSASPRPAPPPPSPSTQSRAAPARVVLTRRISDSYTFPVRGPKANTSSPNSLGSQGLHSQTPRAASRRVASDPFSGRSLPASPLSPRASVKSRSVFVVGSINS